MALLPGYEWRGWGMGVSEEEREKESGEGGMVNIMKGNRDSR